MYLSSKTQAVMNDLHYSLNQVEKARPIIKQLMGGGEIKPVEGRDDEICLMLDRNCGTDYFHVYGKGEKLDGIVWGVGSRFQPICHGKKPYNTFTIRKERASGARTEFEKRKLAIERNGIYPFLTMHGYYDKDTNDILSLAIARTKDIWQCIEEGYAEERQTGANQIGQSKFFCLDWSKVKDLGYPIKIYRK